MLLRGPLCVLASIALVVSAAGSLPVQAGGPKVTILRGTIDGNVTLKPSRTNVIDGIVVVASRATLKIKPGTTVFAGTGSALVVERGGRLIADGTSERPVVFTSAQPESLARRGDWGGIVLNGAARVNDSVNEVDLQDGSGAYGGDVDADSSGVLRYVRIEYAGFPTFGTDRQPSLALRGVGRGTVVENVETINGDGDGVAVLGGSVDARRLVAVGCLGTGVRATAGWNGTMQFVLALVRGDVADHAQAGIEIDNVTGTIANATIVGGGTGIRMAGTSGRLVNAVAAHCHRRGVESQDATTTDAIARRDVTVDGIVLFENANGANVDAELRSALERSGSTLRETDPVLENPFDEVVPNFAPRPDAPVLSGAFDPSDDVSLDPAAFIGAFASGPEPAWTSGWASFRIPPVPRYLAHSSSSPEALGREFLGALAVTDIPAIKRLRITKDEFTWYVWPELPASRLPNISSEFAWSQATLNSLAGLGGVLSQYSGRRFELVGIRFAGGSKAYPGYRVHSDSRVTVRDESGAEYEVKLFGSMLEMDGRYKLFSHVID